MAMLWSTIRWLLLITVVSCLNDHCDTSGATLERSAARLPVQVLDRNTEMASAAVKLCIGIDGGGSSTKITLVDADTGHILHDTKGDPSNWHSVGEQNARKAILNVIRDALTHVDGHVEVVNIAAGISGVSSKDDSERVKSWIQEQFPNAVIEVYNDVVAAVVSGTDGVMSGFALIAGTGSNCMAVDGDRQESAGGWGPLLGSFGSGHALGNRALIACCEAVDGRGPPTLLQSLIESQLGWPPKSFQDNVIPWRYKNGGREWSDVAALAPIVFAAYDQADPVAMTIIDEEVRQLTFTVQTVAKKMGWTDVKQPHPLVLVGSLWKQESFCRKFEQYLSQLGVPYKLANVTMTPAQGMAKFALRRHRSILL